MNSNSESLERFQKTYVPSQSVVFLTLMTFAPPLLIASLLLANIHGTPLMIAVILAGILSTMGFMNLFYELIYDIAGFPELKLPVWGVLYLVVNSIMVFALAIFGMSLGHSSKMDPDYAFVDSVRKSWGNYIGISSTKTPFAISQGSVSLFVNLLIIVKFLLTM